MNNIQICLTFFDDCLTFKEAYRRFKEACDTIDLDDYDDESLKEAAEYYVQVKHELSKICHFKWPKSYSDSDDDMDDDTSADEVSDESDDHDDQDSSNESDNMSTDGEDEEENEDEQDLEDDTILFTPDNCCFEKVLEPFFDAMKRNKLALSTIQREEDEKEEQYERLEKWFESREKCLTAKLLQEICQGFHEKQHRFFKTCSSIHIKVLASYCKNIVKANALEEMFGENYNLLIDDNVPLNKKRKIFKDKDYIDNLITYLKENTLPKVHEFIQARQKHYLQKCTKDD